MQLFYVFAKFQECQRPCRFHGYPFVESRKVHAIGDFREVSLCRAHQRVFHGSTSLCCPPPNSIAWCSLECQRLLRIMPVFIKRPPIKKGRRQRQALLKNIAFGIAKCLRRIVAANHSGMRGAACLKHQALAFYWTPSLMFTVDALACSHFCMLVSPSIPRCATSPR